MKGYIKVPFRQVYCKGFRAWLAESIYCHVVLRLDPPVPGVMAPPRDD